MGKLLRASLVMGLALMGGALFSAGARAAAGAIPSGGITATSVVVGFAGATNGVFGWSGGGWLQRALTGVGGSVILVVDPEPATFYSGRHVFKFPEELLRVETVGWFGEFSADPAAPVPPVSETGFLPFMPVFIPLQAPNPGLEVVVSLAPGEVMIEWEAEDGIFVAGTEHFNFLGIVLSNITDSTLEWELGEGPDFSADGFAPQLQLPSANVYQDAPRQSLICQPVSVDERVLCGDDTGHAFRVFVVPGAPTALLLLPGMVALGVTRRRRRH